MAFLDNLRRIMTEDYPKESRKTIGILSETLNSFMNDVINTVNGQLNFDNYNQELTKIKVYTDASGNIVTEGGTSLTKQIKLNRNTKVAGLSVIKATNLDTATNYPTSSPFISYFTKNQILTISNIKGLVATEEYQLTILIVYES